MPTPHRLLALAGKLLLILVIAEITCDLAVFARKALRNARDKAHAAGPHGDVVWEKDDYLRGRILPGQKEVSAGPSLASFNSLGFRGGEPRPGPPRIVCLGDSVTFGYGVADADAYPAVLARAFPQADVINAGMPRWNSCDLMALYVTRVIPLRPQVLVVMAGWDDITYELATIQERDPAPPKHPVWQAFAESSGLGQVAAAMARRVEAFQRPENVLTDRERAPDIIRWGQMDEFERILASTVRLARANGSRPVLVTLPHFLKPRLSEAEKRTLLPQLLAWPNVSYRGWWRMATGVNQRIRKVAAAQGIPLADCEAAVPPGHFTDLCHLNPDGNRELAACVARAAGPLLAK
jgi:lysophospholipase L1-like esterase